MARPSAFDRDQAIDTAMHELWRNGYKASSVKAISDKLGITRSSYYNAFGSREDLFRAVLERYLSQTPDRALHGDLPDSSILHLITCTFKEIARSRADDQEARGCLMVNVLTELGGTEHPLSALLVDLVLGSAERLEYLLDVAVERGELPNDTDTHGKALALQNLIIGFSIMSKAIRDEDELWLSLKTTLEGLGIYRE